MPRTSPTNKDHAGWADSALTTFMAATSSDREDALCDLLAELIY